MAKGNIGDKRVDRSAAEWAVKLDARRIDRRTDKEFSEWLQRDADNEAALERCELALESAKRLAGDPQLQWAYDEVAHIAKARQVAKRRTFGAWLGRPVLAWTVTGIAIVVASTAWLRPTGMTSAPGPAASAAVSSPSATAASPVTEPPVPAPPMDPTVVLPGLIVVDSRSLAILPFTLVRGAQPVIGDASTAAALYELIADRLEAIPGFYVLTRESTAPFAGLEIVPEQIAAQLGVRAIVEARVSLDGDQIQVDLRLTDAATNAVFADAFVRSLGEIEGMQTDIVANIALAMAAPTSTSEYD